MQLNKDFFSFLGEIDYEVHHETFVNPFKFHLAEKKGVEVYVSEYNDENEKYIYTVVIDAKLKTGMCDLPTTLLREIYQLTK